MDNILSYIKSLGKNKIDYLDNLIDEKDILYITKAIKNFNQIVMEGMVNSNINTILNLGISGEPGINKEFLEFIQNELPDIDRILDENWVHFDINILLTNPFEKAKLKEQISLMDKLFFNNELTTHNLLDYIFRN
jgi:exoribonuclease II